MPPSTGCTTSACEPTSIPTGDVGFTRAELESFRDATIPDLIPEHPKLVFVGINPGLWTAATGTPFDPPGNRFYPALVAAGILTRLTPFSLERTPASPAQH